ncbi:hypothetical protein JWV37_09380 [Sulfurospirillum sp. T05]|uniref:Lipoprotein n=1 Tax=Sulfurospirillum tamanense TaxID=2813362 RepID=A0ABS2WTL5_9BACT|nr:hypothetical protein [Sulfurospirillum tamanensis]MBN2964990.1 hypothetical protein [Sulfurospirillum tamanensis]
MKKQLMIGLMALGMAVLFSGCTVKTESCPLEQSRHQTGYKDVYAVTGKNTFLGPSDGHNKRTRNLHALQNAADFTMQKGFKYFSILNWGHEVNNAAGSMMNTAEEFVQKCLPSSANALTVGNHRCGIATDKQFLVFWLALFNEQQANIMTYKASDVKEYLVENGLWREDGIEVELNMCDKYLNLEK